MNRALVVYDSNKNKEDCILSEKIQKEFAMLGWETKGLDFTADVPDYTCFRTMADYNPNLLVTLNLAGFSLKTDAEEASLNRIPCRMAHLMKHPYENYAKHNNVLSRTINFSMYFLTEKEETALQMQKQFPDIEHIIYMPVTDSIVKKILEITEFE